jgi:hypothetical protein
MRKLAPTEIIKTIKPLSTEINWAKPFKSLNITLKARHTLFKQFPQQRQKKTTLNQHLSKKRGYFLSGKEADHHIWILIVDVCRNYRGGLLGGDPAGYLKGRGSIS